MLSTSSLRSLCRISGAGNCSQSASLLSWRYNPYSTDMKSLANISRTCTGIPVRPVLTPIVLAPIPSARTDIALERTAGTLNNVDTAISRRNFFAAACSAALITGVVSTGNSGKMVTDNANPLLLDVVIPAFDQIKAEHVVPGIKQLLAEANAALDELEKSYTPTWSGLVEPLEKVSDKFGRMWGAVSHLKGVRDSDALREAYDEVEPETVKFSLRMSQSKPLYEGFRALKEGAEWDTLTPGQKRVVELQLRDFVLGGVALEGEAKERYNQISEQLAQLSTKFSNNVLDATKAFKKLITDKSELEGLPASALGLAAQQAKAAGHGEATPENGPWLLTLDYPCYFPVMAHCKNRALREELYRANITRASSGDIDNGPIIEQQLKLRQEEAKLLGFNNYAELSMASKMASLPAADALMDELRVASRSAAEKDLAELQQFAQSQGFTDELKWWDMTFFAERLREAKYDINEEELRPYFPLAQVLDGMFGLAKRIFGVDVQPADGEAPVWHPDVRFFKLFKDGEVKAYFYLDPYSRPEEKRDGAWMDEVVGQSKAFAPAGQQVRLPIAHMVCNQMSPVGDTPSLMTFLDVETLFHEFGHALQHMMTTVEEGMAAGIRNVEWDAVELPSQFMENWCYDTKTLTSFAKHYKTGEPLPEHYIEKLKAAKNFRSGSQLLRQIHFSITDLELHARFTPGQGESPFDRDAKIAANTMVTPRFPEDKFLCSFSHIFGGSYAAGYFSYAWAEVLSADAFSAFEDAGLDNEAAVQETGKRFRDTVLALGGSVEPLEVFKSFRGREPSTEPLLRHRGLAAAVAA